ncbi:MAG: hypothetical protein JW976_05555, partial [Syntrophaceae bacterium]|nr:hypothetical protein [Syntrophaceae bacterium]
MSFRDRYFCRVLLIVLAILFVWMPNSAKSAQKPDANASDKETGFSLADLSIGVAITSPPQESSGVKFYIDACNRIDAFQRISGWVYVEKQQTRGQKVYVQLEKPDGTVVHYSTMPVERPDVGTA